jgi:hypothetical protein
VARRLLLRPGVGERLLTTKLLILNGNGSRRPSMALSMLTGSVAVQRLFVADLLDTQILAAVPPVIPFRRSRHFSARTIYLSEHHLSDIDRIADAWQLREPRRLSRSAVVRRAVEYLYAAVEADPAKFMLENE